MKILRDIEAETRMLLDEVSEKSWFDAEVRREINFAYHEFISTVVTTFEDFYLTQILFDLKNGQQEYKSVDGVPTDIYKVRRVETNYDTAKSTKNYRKAMPINITQVRDGLANSNAGGTLTSLYYVYGFNGAFTIGFVPVPSKDSTDGVKLWYVQNITDLVNLTDVVNIPYADRFAKGISLIASAMLLRKSQQEEPSAERYMIEGQAMKQQMMEELEDRVADDSKVIMDSLGADLDFGEPF